MRLIRSGLLGLFIGGTIGYLLNASTRIETALEESLSRTPPAYAFEAIFFVALPAAVLLEGIRWRMRKWAGGGEG